MSHVNIRSNTRPGIIYTLQLDQHGFVRHCPCKSWKFRNTCSHALAASRVAEFEEAKRSLLFKDWTLGEVERFWVLLREEHKVDVALELMCLEAAAWKFFT